MTSKRSADAIESAAADSSSPAKRTKQDESASDDDVKPAPENEPSNSTSSKEPEKDSATVDDLGEWLDSSGEERLSKQESEGKTELTSPSLVIFGLHPKVNQEKLEKLMSEFGDLTDVEVKMAFASRYGLCKFERIEDAQTALNCLDGRALYTKPLMVKPAEGKRSKPRLDS